jgi:hypothetical protein
MHAPKRLPLIGQFLACWNWKCALLSATARSVVYLAAMAHGNRHGRLSIILVEMAYVTLTAGLYAGMQQRSLGFRSRRLGNLTVVLGVPALAQFFDWFTHRVAGAPVPPKALVIVCIYAVVTALFHLHVMRNGAFLTGHAGRSFVDDFRRLPRLLAGFAVRPMVLLSARAARIAESAESEAAL